MILLIVGREVFFTTKILCKYDSVRSGEREVTGNKGEQKVECSAVSGSVTHINIP